MTANRLRHDLGERLSQLEATLATPDFLRGKGLGNEIAFYIFDYNAACDPMVQAYIPRLIASLRDKNVSVLEFNLYTCIVEVLKERGFLEKAIELEAKKGADALAKGVGRVIRPEKLLDKMRVSLAEPCELVFLTGVGAAWPLVRSHTILNNLHAVIDDVPLVMFYPGTYTGQGLQLFASLTDDNYYRAFPLLSETGGTST